MQLDLVHPTLLGRLPDNEQDRTRETLQRMSALVRRFKKPGTLTWQSAHDLVRELPPKNYAAEIAALHGFVRDHIRYTKDVHGVEAVQYPDTTLDIGMGDCDDKATLLASQLGAIGHPSRFIAIGKAPGRYSHVFVQTLLGNKWVSLDPTMAVAAGWAPSHGVGSVMILNN
jgi:transglutaminase-like putative cysteine protease